MAGGGWYELINILKDQADPGYRLVDIERLTCPNDGEPLTTAPDGGYFCRFDGWRPSGSGVTAYP